MTTTVQSPSLYPCVLISLLGWRLRLLLPPGSREGCVGLQSTGATLAAPDTTVFLLQHYSCSSSGLVDLLCSSCTFCQEAFLFPKRVVQLAVRHQMAGVHCCHLLKTLLQGRLTPPPRPRMSPCAAIGPFWRSGKLAASIGSIVFTV